MHVSQVPQQPGSEECGVFALYNAKLFILNAPDGFSVQKGYFPYFVSHACFIFYLVFFYGHIKSISSFLMTYKSLVYITSYFFLQMTPKWFTLDDVEEFRRGLRSAEKNVDEVGSDELETSSDSGHRLSAKSPIRTGFCPPVIN